MSRILLILLSIDILFSVDYSENRPVNTYSIVAYDDSTGQLGVAVQSHWFSVGSLVPWAKAGVGAVATQSLVKVEYGPDGLKVWKMKGSPCSLSELLANDEGRDLRQVAMIDANEQHLIRNKVHFSCRASDWEQLFSSGKYYGKTYRLRYGICI